MNSKSLLVLTALALAGSPAVAGNGASVSGNRLLVAAPPQPAAQAWRPPENRDAKLTAVFDNIGRKYPKSLYLCCLGGTIGGPNSQVGTVWQAEQFTPSSSVTVSEIEVGVGYLSGANGVTIALYSDSHGLPGTALASQDVTGLPPLGSCCQIATGTFQQGVAVTAGTHYWVVLETGAQTSTTLDGWNLNTTDGVDVPVIDVNFGSGWQPVAPVTSFAFAVLGK